MQLIPTIGLAKFKLHPTRNAQENAITCVLSNNNTAFYTVTHDRMKELLDAESLSKDQDTALYTAYDCAISALDLTDDKEIKMYLNEIIKCYIGDKEFNRINKEKSQAQNTANYDLNAEIREIVNQKKSYINENTKTYIVRKKGTTQIKIGKSIRVDRRISDISNISGCELDVILIINKDIESELHREFSHLRTIGEWFNDNSMEIQKFASKGEQWVIQKFISEGLI